MLRTGTIVLTLGESFQLLVSILSLIVSLFARHAPIWRMVFADDELPRLDPKANAVVKSLAILHNSGAVLCSVFVLVVIWTSLIDGAKWAFWLVLFAGAFGHAMWFVSDAVIGYKTVPVNAILTVVFLVLAGSFSLSRFVPRPAAITRQRRRRLLLGENRGQHTERRFPTSLAIAQAGDKI